MLLPLRWMFYQGTTTTTGGGGGGWYTPNPAVKSLIKRGRKKREPIPLTEENIPKIAKAAEEDIGALIAAYLYWDE